MIVTATLVKFVLLARSLQPQMQRQHRHILAALRPGGVEGMLDQVLAVHHGREAAAAHPA